MASKRFKSPVAWLLAAVMLIAPFAPASFAASQDGVTGALSETFDYYKDSQGGVLGGWEALAAAYISGEDLTEYSLPKTDTGTASTSVLIALMKGDMTSARTFAMGVGAALAQQSYTYVDALELIAIEAYNRAARNSSGVFPTVSYNADTVIGHLLSTLELDGGFAGFGSGGDPDTTGMALAALALFNDASHSDVRNAVNGALTYLHNVQQSNGGFSSSWSGNNSNSAAAVLWGLSALGQNIARDWVKNGSTPVDALLSFQTPNGGFGITDTGTDDSFATSQAALALAQIGNAGGKNFFTDLGQNNILYKSLYTSAVDADSGYHERSVTVRSGDTLSSVVARALRTEGVNAGDYDCYSGGARVTDILSLDDGADMLVIHNAFENVVYFEAADGDKLGVNAVGIALGDSATLRLMITSAGAISPSSSSPLPGVSVHVNGSVNPGAVTNESGYAALGVFTDAGIYNITVQPGDVPGAPRTAVLPAKITVKNSAAQTVMVSVRVEGVYDNIMSQTLPVGNSGDKTLTVLDAVKTALDTAGKDYIIKHDTYGDYIASIDGVAQKTGGAGNDGGGSDGWLYTFASEVYLNGGKSLTGMAGQPIADGDEIVVYYGNYDYSTLFPLVDVSLNADGGVTVRLEAWRIDWTPPDYAMTATLIPIPDVNVSWAENTAYAYTGKTDANGELVVPSGKAPVGKHTLQIDKKDQFDLPDVVRLAPGYAVEVTKGGVTPSVPSAPASDEVYVRVTGPAGSIFARTGLPWSRGATPLIMLAATKLDYKTDSAGDYVSEIGGIAEFDYGPNSGWLYKVNGIETIKDSAKVYKLNAGDELEWFYTSDYTKEAGSSAWSSSPPAPADDGAVAVSLRPEVTVVDGAAEVKLSDDDIKKVVSDAARDKASEIVITPNISGEANKVSVELSAASVRGIAGETGAKLTLATPLGDMSVAHAGLAALSGSETGPLTLSIERGEEGTVSVSVSVAGKTVQTIEGGLKLRVPASGTPTAGTVALLVKDDGSEEVILLSMVSGNDIVAVLGGSAKIRIAELGAAFDDVGAGAWFKDDADFVSARNLFKGVGEREFAGDASMTRGMLAQVFHRLAGSPSAGGGAFSDVSDSAWYSEAAAWAADSGVILGMDGSFAGDMNITREQLAAMAMRFAGSVGADMGAPAELTGFTDASGLSSWATDAVKWAVGTGILSGDDRSRLNAGGFATRAEVAAITRRFVENWIATL